MVCVDATAGLIEQYVARKIGRDAYAEIAASFVDNDGAGLLKDRRCHCLSHDRTL